MGPHGYDVLAPRLVLQAEDTNFTLRPLGVRQLDLLSGRDARRQRHNGLQFSLAKAGYWVYDFALPYLILEALLTQRCVRLAEYLRARPHNQFTMLDCHDGIPVKPDLDGLADERSARRVAERCVRRGANLSRIVSDGDKGEDGFDVHQIRCAWDESGATGKWAISTN